MKKTFYLTTPIYYPSGKFHIGTAYTTVLADAIKRYHILKGEDAYLLTGTDEHGQKIQEKAQELGKTPKEYVDGMAALAKELWAKMGIEYDDFIQTTEERHEKIVQKIFDFFMEKGDIYKGEYKGLYCVPCETFFTPTQLVDGKCPDCGREVREASEEAYFFNMKKYADKLLKYYEEHPDFVKPDYRKTEMINNFIKPGLEDLCVSRTTFDWGVKVLKDQKHVVYVWLDALTNYITALGFWSEDDSKFKKYWPASLHIVGKDIARFHLIYWPIFLMALDLPLPKTVLVHNWIMMKDGKMSKSKGNVIYPEELIDRYGLDAVKYFLLREMPVSQDGLFSPESFVERFNFDLCNDLSNLLNRTVSMVNKYFEGQVPKYNGTQNEVDKEIEEYANSQVQKFEEIFNNYEIANAIQEIWNLVSRTNKYIDETSPWVLAKEEQTSKLEACMYHLVENLRKIAILIRPFMLETSNNILRQLGIQDEKLKTWESLNNYDKIQNVKVIEKGEPIFMRLNAAEEIEFMQNLMKNRK
ncbi:MAG: methionine--tRNA ligase [Clostridia bacterium]|nr:methionine--tRNA ligase [Clostridia bacterium]